MATLKEMFEGNTADILEATELLKVLGDREGQYVWKQLTAEGGDFVAFVTADDEGSYPNKGTQDGYYYVKFDPLTAIAENIREGVSIFDIIGTMSEGVSGIDFGEVTPSSATQSLTINHSLSAVPKFAVITSSNILNLVSGLKTNRVAHLSSDNVELRVSGANSSISTSSSLEVTSTQLIGTVSGKFEGSHKYYWFAQA